MINDSTYKKIDVVIPVYNGEKFILQALNSVAHQTLPPNKIIVVDDGSTDNTYSVVLEYAKTCSLEIKIIKQENGGLSSARNTGIKESMGEFIAFLDADDIWDKNKLEEQMNVCQTTEFENLALVYCDYDVIDINGNTQYRNYKAPLDKKRMRGMVFEKLLERNQITSSGSGVLIKRNVFDVVGFFDENLKYAEDFDMWLRIAQKFEVDFVAKILVHIRKHNENMTFDPSKTFEKELTFYSKWMSTIDGHYPIPLLWSDKITYRILAGFPQNNLLKTLRAKLPAHQYKKMFRITFGSFYLYLPVFLIRQIFNLIFYPKYISILFGFIKNKGK
ncbi:MAG: glycosyltransferase [Patescibacteria group bacterium]